MLRLKKFGEKVGLSNLWLKDDGTNPTGSFKARGLSCAISMCKELGIKVIMVVCRCWLVGIVIVVVVLL